MGRTSGKKKRGLHRDQYRYVTLKITARDLDPAEVTKALGVEPAWQHWRGAWTAPTGAKCEYAEGSWSLASRLRRNCTLENHIRDVWDQVSERKASLRHILKKASADLHISVQPHRDVVNWNHVFPADLLKNFVDMGIHIWFSFWDPCAWDRIVVSKADGKKPVQTKRLPKQGGRPVRSEDAGRRS